MYCHPTTRPSELQRKPRKIVHLGTMHLGYAINGQKATPLNIRMTTGLTASGKILSLM